MSAAYGDPKLWHECYAFWVCGSPNGTEIGSDARNSHKCQGMTGLPPLPGVNNGRGGGPNIGGFELMDSTIPGQVGKDETSLFEGIDTSLSALAQYAGPNPPAALTAGIAAIVQDAKRAQTTFEDGNDAATAAPVARAAKKNPARRKRR